MQQALAHPFFRRDEVRYVKILIYFNYYTSSCSKIKIVFLLWLMSVFYFVSILLLLTTIQVFFISFLFVFTIIVRQCMLSN